MTNYVLPGQSFFVTYVSDGVTILYPVPDITAQTEDVIVTLNGIVQQPYVAYTVHQGNLRFAAGAPNAGFTIMIRV